VAEEEEGVAVTITPSMPLLLLATLLAAGAGPADAQDATAAATNGPGTLRVADAVIMALSRNRALSVERLTPDIRRTAESEERAAFDPVLAADGFVQPEAGGTLTSTSTVDRAGGGATVRERLPTGTDLAAGLRTEREKAGGDADPTYGTTAELGVTQALLQGRPVAVNLARLRQARLDTAISEYELRGVTETLVADVETTYWDVVLAERRVGIVETSLDFAERQLREIEQRIRVGSLPETERAAAQAETALRREVLINARGGVATARLRLLRLVDPDALASRRRDLVLADGPVTPRETADPVEQHVKLALRRRPDMNQARLAIARGDLEVVRTRNGLLPKLDVFVTLGQTAYANSFDDSARDLDGNDLNVNAGLRFELPFGNRAARARHGRAVLSREQSDEALRNLADLVRVDVETAHIDVLRTREQIDATATTRQFQEEKVRAEQAKFKVGRSTALLVAQTERDLVLSQLAEIESVVRHLQAFVALFRLDGSILERRGIAAPGAGE
jgi:outer membrane protein TolC